MERAGGGSKRHSAVAGKGGAKKILPAGWRFFCSRSRSPCRAWNADKAEEGGTPLHRMNRHAARGFVERRHLPCFLRSGMMRRAVRGRCSVLSSEGRRVGRRNEAVPQCRTHGATAECVCIEPRRNEGGAWQLRGDFPYALWGRAKKGYFNNTHVPLESPPWRDSFPIFCKAASSRCIVLGETFIFFARIEAVTTTPSTTDSPINFNINLCLSVNCSTTGSTTDALSSSKKI